MPDIDSRISDSLSRTRPGRVLLKVVLATFLLWCAVSSVIFVDETEDVIVETLGRMTAVYDRHDSQSGDRGLHFKAPWPFAIARRFDRRQQLYDPPGRELFTRDKKNVTVSSYLCWRIAEPTNDMPLEERPVVRFFRGLGNQATAEARLDARLRSVLSTAFGRVELSELLLVSANDSGSGPPAQAAAQDSALGRIGAACLLELRQRGDESHSLPQRLGIEIVDLRIKRINLPEGNRYSVYERMRTERERIAERYRSAGRAEKTRIESQARRQSAEIMSRAEADAERIRGEGEAEAIALLNRAHSQDPEFYEFQRTLATYSKILNERTTLVLSASSRLFQLLTEGVPGPSSANSKKLVPSPTPVTPTGEAPRGTPR